MARTTPVADSERATQPFLIILSLKFLSPFEFGHSSFFPNIPDHRDIALDDLAAQPLLGREQSPPGDFAWREWSRNLAALSAPAESGGKLIAPGLEHVGAIAKANRDAVVGASYDLQGRP